MADNQFIIEIRSKGFGPAKSNTKALKGSISKLRQEVNNHKKALEKAEIGSDKFNKAQKELERSTKKLQEGLGKVTKKVKGYSKEADGMRGVTSGLRRSVGALRNNLLLISFTLGAVIAGVKKFVDAAAGFEAVKTRLVGLTGSVNNAARAFDKFNAIAGKTPFSLDDVVNAGAQLKAFGADAEALIQPISNLAAFMGTTATEAANAFGRAFAGGAGAADILRERGILNIIKSSQGLTDLSKTTLPEFRRALIETLQDPTVGIEGSADRLSKTFVGAMSNMKDGVTRASAAIGDLLIPGLITLAKGVQDVSKDITDFFKRLSESNFQTAIRHVKELGVAFKGMDLADAKLSLIDIDDTLKNLDITITSKVNKSLAGLISGGMGGGFVHLTEEAKRAREALGGITRFDGNFEKLGSTAETELKRIANQLAPLLELTELSSDQEKQLSSLSKEYEKWAELSALVAERNKSIEDRKEALKEFKKEVEALNEGPGMTFLINPIPPIEESEQQLHDLEVKVQESMDKIANKMNDLSLGDFDLGDTFGEIDDLTWADEWMEDWLEDQKKIQEEFHQFAVDVATDDMKRLEESQKKVAKEAKDAATSIGRVASAVLGLANAMKDEESSLGDYVAAIGQIAMLIPGGQAFGAIMSTGGQLMNIAGVGHTGGLITNNGIQTFATGGMVQGGDNVPILAQGGEFIMNRGAVDNIGLQRLAAMNETDSMSPGSVTVNISAPLVDETIVDHIIPAIKNAANLDLA